MEHSPILKLLQKNQSLNLKFWLAIYLNHLLLLSSIISLSVSLLSMRYFRKSSTIVKIRFEKHCLRLRRYQHGCHFGFSKWLPFNTNLTIFLPQQKMQILCFQGQWILWKYFISDMEKSNKRIKDVNFYFN